MAARPISELIGLAARLVKLPTKSLGRSAIPPTQLHVKVVFVTGSQSSQTTLSQLSIWFLTSQNYSKHFPLFRILLNYFLLEYKTIKHE